MRSGQKHVGSSIKTVLFYAKTMIFKMDPIRNSHVCLMAIARFSQNNRFAKFFAICLYTIIMIGSLNRNAINISILLRFKARFNMCDVD